MDTPALPPDLKKRIEQFRVDRPSYDRADFNEASCRLQFLDPLFLALGWDVNNSAGLAERFKEVQLEPSQEIEEGRKGNPDYSFRIGGTPVFFVEAKKPSVRLKDNKEAAAQIRRYCWSRNLPIGLLTNFAEFSVYDCRTKVLATERASTRRLAYFTINEFEDNWEDLARLFTKDSIMRGGMERWVEGAPARSGTQTVDKVFLGEIEVWREALATNIALRNPALDQRALNRVVGATIDRIVFLRICEDRHIENPNTLLDTTKGKGIYQALCAVFELADKKYNSGLFHFGKEAGRPEDHDDVSLGLVIDDKVLRPIITGLYQPESPYQFSVIPSHILGQVYEQFLGKVITLKGRNVTVEDKPEVKKAGGVVYTPAWVVEDIVERTLEPLFAGKTPGQVSGANPIRVVDPACGSGTFLIGAYEWILTWYMDAYAADPVKWSKGNEPRIIKRGPTWHLSTNERKRILLAHVFGVDIDQQAVEVTKLSLLLKVLEGETLESIQQEFSFALERALPDLDSNIRSGNSLIDGKFYVNYQMALSEDEEARINVFDWAAAFGPSGKFDAIVGNPPYVRIQHLQGWAPIEAEYLKTAYQTASEGNFDLYVPFMERSLALLSPRGRLGFIVSSKWLTADYGKRLRELIGGGKHLEELIHFGDQQVFDRRTTYTCILQLTAAPNASARITKVHNLPQWRYAGAAESGELPAAELVGDGSWHLPIGKSGELYKKLTKLTTRLSDVTTGIHQGVITGADPVYLFEQVGAPSGSATNVYSAASKSWILIETELLRPVVRSGQASIGGYWGVPSAWVMFPYLVEDGAARLYTPQEMAAQFPKAWAYLQQHRPLLEARDRGAFKDSTFYRFGRTQNLAKWDRTKVMVPYMVKRLAGYLDEGDDYFFVNVTTGGYAVISDQIDYRYLCAVLNSDLAAFYLRFVSEPFQGGYIAANKQYLEQIPVVLPDRATADGEALFQRICGLVTQTQEAYRKVTAGGSADARKRAHLKAAVFAEVINNLINTVYGYSSADIEIATAPYVPDVGADDEVLEAVGTSA